VYADQLKQREDMSAVSPGIFKESDDANRVYFVENYTGSNGSARNIFYQDVSNGKISSIFARSGHLSTDHLGQRVLVLENGQRYIGMPGQADFDVTEFKRHTVAIDQGHGKLAIPNSRQSQGTLLLMRQLNDPAARSELAWRISLPFSCLILAILAIPLAYVNPRSGQTYNLIGAILVYFVYQNALTFVRNGILHDNLPVYSMLLVHLLALVLALLALVYRDHPTSSLARTIKNLSGRRSEPCD
jgi:lipopolysaccharide export system permease protein